MIYIDSIAGGFTTTQNFTDTADGGRRAISGYNGTNRSTLNFASGFAADYAIALDSSFAGIFQLQSNGSHSFVASANRTNVGSDFELNLTLSNISLTPGGTFKYVGTYLNKNSVERSNEFHGVASYAFGNPGHGTVSLASDDFNVFTSVPEISPALGIPFAVALVAGTIGGWRRWKARPAS